LIKLAEEIGNCLEAQVLFLDMRHVTRVLEDHPAATRHVLDVWLDHERGRFIFSRPQKPYRAALIHAVPDIDPDKKLLAPKIAAPTAA